MLTREPVNKRCPRWLSGARNRTFRAMIHANTCSPVELTRFSLKRLSVRYQPVISGRPEMGRRARPASVTHGT